MKYQAQIITLHSPLFFVEAWSKYIRIKMIAKFKMTIMKVETIISDNYTTYNRIKFKKSTCNIRKAVFDP